MVPAQQRVRRPADEGIRRTRNLHGRGAFAHEARGRRDVRVLADLRVRDRARHPQQPAVRADRPHEVDQQIKEGEQTSNVKATYTVKVYVDADGDMVIVQNPTLTPAIEKSDYEPKTPEADASVDADTVNDATAFLETFFKLYPTATEKELAYYVFGNVIEPIGRDYLYSELVNPIFTKDGDNVKVKVAVKFLDNQTKATQVSQYELVLHKDSNWKIVG